MGCRERPLLGLCQKGKRKTALGGQIRDLVLLLLSLGFLKVGVPEVSELSSCVGEGGGRRNSLWSWLTAWVG